jgi:hypothetical protein
MPAPVQLSSTACASATSSVQSIRRRRVRYSSALDHGGFQKVNALNDVGMTASQLRGLGRLALSLQFRDRLVARRSARRTAHVDPRTSDAPHRSGRSPVPRGCGRTARIAPTSARAAPVRRHEIRPGMRRLSVDLSARAHRRIQTCSRVVPGPPRIYTPRVTMRATDGTKRRTSQPSRSRLPATS